MPILTSHEPIGVRIRQLREKKGWSLTDLAERSGVSRSYIFQLESGKSAPTEEKILQLANAFGALPSELLGETVEDITISDSLQRFATAANLGSGDIQMLARIEYRGKRPSTVEEWKAIYSVIKGMLEHE